MSEATKYPRTGVECSACKSTGTRNRMYTCSDCGGKGFRWNKPETNMLATITRLELEKAELVTAVQTLHAGPTEQPYTGLTGEWLTGFYCGLEDVGAVGDSYQCGTIGYEVGCERMQEWIDGELSDLVKKHTPPQEGGEKEQANCTHGDWISDETARTDTCGKCNKVFPVNLDGLGGPQSKAAFRMRCI